MQATLLPGDRLGPYEITSRIGAGGMGEVYRARDTRLHRTVAIKVLKQELIGDAASRERFEREAQAIAALEHPGICTLHDVGEHGDTRFLVMAFVEGEALAALLDQGPLPINRVTQYAFELANALDAAHRAGIVHRDLKPGNVMVTKNGVILLDFGLARLASTEALRIDSATTLAISEPGILIGTLAYMAPEQVEGKQSDHRADIFALGAVIFEMATGRRPFESDNPARLMAAILNTEPPPISTMRSDWPQSLDWAVSECLAKNPDDRWHSTRDFSDHLKWALANVPAGRHATEPRNDKRRAWTVIPLLSAAVIAALAALWVTSRPETRSLPLAQFSIDLPDGVRLAPEPASPTLAFSPDGEHLYFSALKDGDQQIFARAINALDVRAVTGTEGGGNPFVSPDGKWLGFTARGLLNKIPVGGGSAVSITATPDLTGASWNAANEIALAPSNRSGLVKVSDKGGATSPLTNLGGSVPGTSHRFPEFLPGGRAVLFTAGPPASGGWYDADVFAQPLSAGDPQVVIQGAAQAHYARSGHLVYARAGSLYAVPFDARALKVTGKAVAVLKGVSEDQGSGDAQYTISESGSLAYVPGGLRRNEVLRVDRSGRVEPLITDSERACSANRDSRPTENRSRSAWRAATTMCGFLTRARECSLASPPEPITCIRRGAVTAGVSASTSRILARSWLNPSIAAKHPRSYSKKGSRPRRHTPGRRTVPSSSSQCGQRQAALMCSAFASPTGTCNRLCRAPLPTLRRRCRRMDGGSPTRLMRQEGLRFTYGRSRAPVRAHSYRDREASNRCGRRTAGSCFSESRRID